MRYSLCLLPLSPRPSSRFSSWPRLFPRPFLLWKCCAAALLLVCMATLTGCPEPDPEISRTLSPHTVWEQHKALRKQTQETIPALTAQASLNYKTPARSGRVILKLWGNMAYPLRLDVQAGIGASAAFWREDHSGWLGFFPLQDQAFTHTSGSAGLTTMGLDMPLSLRDIAAVMSGNWAWLVPADYGTTRQATGQATQQTRARATGFTYTFEPAHFTDTFGVPGAFSTAVLDAQARITELSGMTPAGRQWTLKVRYDDRQTRQPTRFTFTAGPAIQAVLRIKKFTPRRQLWKQHELALDIPAHIPVHTLTLRDVH